MPASPCETERLSFKLFVNKKYKLVFKNLIYGYLLSRDIKLFMTLSLNIGNLFNDSSSHALVDELRKRTSEEDILDFEEKFNSKNEKNLHVYICRFLKNRSISRGLASRWLITIIENKVSKIDALQKLNN